MRKGEAAKLVLAILAAGAVGITLATIPGAAGALVPFVKKKSKHMPQKTLQEALRRLQRQRMVQFVATKDGEQLSISNRGKQYLRKLDFDTLQLEVPRRWDGQWSVILFDIPETHKTARDALRRKLRQLGCFQYHKSVFVHPAPCEDEIDFIAELFQIRNYVTVFRTKSLGHQEHRAYRYFSLKP